jgi:hypothetical protein
VVHLVGGFDSLGKGLQSEVLAELNERPDERFGLLVGATPPRYTGVMIDKKVALPILSGR